MQCPIPTVYKFSRPPPTYHRKKDRVNISYLKHCPLDKGNFCKINYGTLVPPTPNRPTGPTDTVIHSAEQSSNPNSSSSPTKIPLPSSLNPPPAFCAVSSSTSQDITQRPNSTKSSLKRSIIRRSVKVTKIAKSGTVKQAKKVEEIDLQTASLSETTSVQTVAISPVEKAPTSDAQLPASRTPRAPSLDSTTALSERPAKKSRPAFQIYCSPPLPFTLQEQIIPLNKFAYWLLLGDQSIIVAGLLRLTCFAGTVKIAGFSCKPGDPQIIVPSLVGSESLVTVYGDKKSGPVEETDFKLSVAAVLPPDEFASCLTALRRFSGRVFAVALVVSTNEISDPNLWDLVRRYPNLRPEVSFAGGKLSADLVSRPIFPACRLIAGNAGRKIAYVDYQEEFWCQIQRELNSYPPDFRHVILICGDKGTGKSTTVRFIINSLLNHFLAVQCLDCDLGQSEFNPPGCLAIHTLNQPLLGSTFSRLHTPHVACFVGDTSPKDIIPLYEKALERVFYTGRNAELPLVINTMGWIRDAGLRLLQKTAQLVRPTLVFELNATGRLTVTKQLIRSGGNRSVALFSDVPVVVGASCFEPAAKRKMSQLAYLNRELSIFDRTPYAALFSHVDICFTVRGIPPSHYLTTLVGSYVGLSCYNPSTLNDITVKQFGCVRILDSPPVASTYGFGIVRGIDLSQGVCFIATPLPEETLALVNLIFRGTITMPNEIFQQQTLENNRPRGYMPRMQSSFEKLS